MLSKQPPLNSWRLGKSRGQVGTQVEILKTTRDFCGFRIRYYELNISNFTFKYSGLFLLIRTYYNSPQCSDGRGPQQVWGVNDVWKNISSLRQ